MIRVELRDRANANPQTLTGAKGASYHAVLNSDGAGTFLIHRSDPAVASLGMLTGGIDRYIVHLQRKGPLEAAFTDRFSFVVESVGAGLDDQEEASAWVTVAGRGTLCLLEDRIAYPPGYDGVTQSTVTGQWQNYASTPGGAIMGGEITRSNGRFVLALTHSVDTSTVPQTVTLRFDNLRKLHDYLVSNGMDAQMIGTDYQTVDNLGTDKSASITVRLSPQDSLRGVALQRDSRPVKNYVVAQGTGEGINALLRSSSDTASIAAFRRREGFLDARQDANATQLALRASSAVKELKAADQRITCRFIDNAATQLYRDFGLGDTITLSALLLGLSAPYRVVGFSVADTDAEVEEIALDLNDLRLEYLLKLATGAALTADSLNVLSRMPQGAPYNNSRNGDGNCTPTFPFHFNVFIESNVQQLNYGKLSFFLQAFRRDVAALNTATSGASSAASSAGGSTHTHGVSGQTTGGTTSGSPSALHSHDLSVGAGTAGTAMLASGPTAISVNAGAAGPGNWTSSSDSVSHTHAVPSETIAAVTSTAENAHTHGIPHTHDVVPGLTDGIWEGAVATGVTVKINGVDRTVALGGGVGFTTNQTELEVSQWLNIGAWNTVDLTPTGLGRISADLRITGFIQSV